MKTFAELLSLYINQAGITDSELARAIGVSRQTIFRWREGTTSRPNNREDVLAISKKLRLPSEEKDNLLLAAGFRPEDTVSPDNEYTEVQANKVQKANATDASYTGLESEEEKESENFLVKSGKPKIFISRRLFYLVIFILACIVIIVLILRIPLA